MTLILVLSLVLFAAGLWGGMTLDGVSVAASLFLIGATGLRFLFRSRRESREFHREYRRAQAEDRSYYPKSVKLSRQEVDELATCPGGCSTGMPRLARMEYRGDENKADVQTRWGREVPTVQPSQPAANPNGIPAPSWPVRIAPIPDGIPLPDEQPERINMPLWRR